MRAVRTHLPGDAASVVVETVDDPSPGPGEVVVAVRAAALNYPDVLLVADRYQMRPPRPFIPGSEVAGVIEQVGQGVTAFKPGDRVIGLAPWGGLAEKLCLGADGCIPIPDAMPFDEASALVVTYATGYYALVDCAALKAGETVLVLGAAGGVGLAAVELAKALGAKVVAAASSQDKADAALAKGADAAVVYPASLDTPQDARAFTESLRQACGEGGADVIVDPVGGPYAEAAFRAVAWGGRHLVIGFVAGIPKLPLNLPLLKGASVVGVFYGEFCRRDPAGRDALLQSVADLYAKGAIRPHISARLPLDRAAEGLVMMERREAAGKIVIVMDGAAA